MKSLCSAPIPPQGDVLGPSKEWLNGSSLSPLRSKLQGALYFVFRHLLSDETYRSFHRRKKNQKEPILRCDWLPKMSYLVRSVLSVGCRKKIFPESQVIDPLLIKMAGYCSRNCFATL